LPDAAAIRPTGHSTIGGYPHLARSKLVLVGDELGRATTVGTYELRTIGSHDPPIVVTERRQHVVPITTDDGVPLHSISAVVVGVEGFGTHEDHSSEGVSHS
jgi:hypothetical protein